MKHHRGTARAGDWVLAGVERETSRCFIVPCPGVKWTAAVLMPLIQRWVLPGTTIYTDGWRAYQQLPDLGYTHSCVNHTLYFKDPVTGVHTNRQEGLWKHIRAGGFRKQNSRGFLCGLHDEATLHDWWKNSGPRYDLDDLQRLPHHSESLRKCVFVLFIFKFNFNMYFYIYV